MTPTPERPGFIAPQGPAQPAFPVQPTVPTQPSYQAPPPLIPPTTPPGSAGPATAVSVFGGEPPRRPALPEDLEATRAHHPFFDTEEGRALAASSPDLPGSPGSPAAPANPFAPRNPEGHAGVPTQAMPPLEPTQAMPFATTGIQGTDTTAQESDSGALDSLFGESNFVEYEDKLIPVGGAAVASAVAASAPRTEVPKGVLWTGLGIVVALLAIAMFLLGTRLPAMLADSEPGVAVPVLPEQTVGPVMPGTHAWDALLGTECLEPFTSAWQDSYLVLPCIVPHGGQLLATGEFLFASFPGAAQLEAQAKLECTTPGLLNLEAAGEYTDVQISVSYPASQEQWDAGARNYYCFVSRAEAGPLTGSLAVEAPPEMPEDDEDADVEQ